jgi:hypothetical protein
MTSRTVWSTVGTSLSNSSAQVRVYRGGALVASFNVPSGQSGTLWTVFEMTGDSIAPVSTLTFQSAPAEVQAVPQTRQWEADWLPGNLRPKEARTTIPGSTPRPASPVVGHVDPADAVEPTGMESRFAPSEACVGWATGASSGLSNLSTDDSGGASPGASPFGDPAPPCVLSGETLDDKGDARECVPDQHADAVRAPWRR